MASARYILDTNILTAILKRDPVATVRVNLALQANAEFVMCPVVFYEIRRGLLHKDARKQLGFLLRYVSTYTWDDLKRTDWEQAAELWAECGDLCGRAHASRRNRIDHALDIVRILLLGGRPRAALKCNGAGSDHIDPDLLRA